MIRYSELQIGDFVLVNGKPRKVASVTRRKIGYSVGEAGKGLCYVRLQDVEPIPITDAFFKQNGFVKNLCYWEYRIDNQTWLEFYKHENRLSRYWRGIDEWDNHSHVRKTAFKCCGIHYVHELQHALKLCYCKQKEWKFNHADGE